MDDQTPILAIKGIGEKTAKLFSKLNIETAGDLIRHFPRDYERFEQPRPIRELIAGETAAVLASVVSAPAVKKVRSLTIFHLTVRDEDGLLPLVFFNMPYLTKMLKPGMHYVFRGTVQARGASLIMEQPKVYSMEEYRKLTGSLQPKYPLTKGLTSQSIQRAVQKALADYAFEPEFFPQEIMQTLREANLPLLSKPAAYQKIHLPTDPGEAAEAHRRLAFEEFFDFLLLLRKNQAFAESLPNTWKMIETADTVRYVDSLPFRLTKGQKQAWQEIRDDLEGPRCMNRLVQGDVGSGKTVIAMLALLMTAANGFQGALMAPTEVLAMQHYEGVLRDTGNYHLAFRPALLIGSMSAKEKREIYEKIASGEVNLVIGTHALLQEKVTFQKLALVVTDEQHRFGVRQRETLAGKGAQPHILVMSATPIPRTLAMILYGDLQISVIKELPADRLPIKNCVVGTSFRAKAYQFIADQVAQGHQAYVICPQVEEGEMEDLENVTQYAEKLRAALPPSVIVAHLHGKMRPAEKNQIMEEFARHNIDVLVSTTVIEVGINVPNATVMMVENAERFGLAQLHQLRGRVGRGGAQSYCIFISTSDKKETMERLEILNHSNDGFYIASEDLKLRGPGDLFGIRQSGEFAFRIGDIYTDAELLKAAAQAVEELLSKDPELALDEHRALRAHLEAPGRNPVDFRTI